MAASGGGGDESRRLVLGSSVDQQQQHQQQQLRRSSASNFGDQLKYPSRQQSVESAPQSAAMGPDGQPQQQQQQQSSTYGSPPGQQQAAGAAAAATAATTTTATSTLSAQANQLQQQQQSQVQQNQHQQQQRGPATKDESIDVVFNRLMALEAFRSLHPSVIRNLCSYAFVERVDKGVVVFRQGDDAINWYALLEGSVDVRVAQVGGQKDGVTLCTLGVGTTFGASVMPGKSHSVSVVTNEDCTLLRVRRADFQEIFEEQSHLIGDVAASPFCSLTTMEGATGQAVGASGPLHQEDQQQQQHEHQQPAPPPLAASMRVHAAAPLASMHHQHQYNQYHNHHHHHHHHQKISSSQNVALVDSVPGVSSARLARRLTLNGRQASLLANSVLQCRAAGNHMQQHLQQQAGPAERGRRSSLAPAINNSMGPANELTGSQQRRQSIVGRPQQGGHQQSSGSPSDQAAAAARRQQQQQQLQSRQLTGDQQLIQQKLASSQLLLDNGHSGGHARADAAAAAGGPAVQDESSPVECLDGGLAYEDDDDNNGNNNDQQQQQRQLEEEELNNLDSLDADELSSQLTRVSWVLRTLMLANSPQLVQNRRVYPHLQHLRHSAATGATGAQQHQPPQSSSHRQSLVTTAGPTGQQHKSHGHRLVSRGSSSQLLGGSGSAASATNSSSATSTSSSIGSSTKSAGRKVANYVASSFMRSSNAASQASNAHAASNSNNNNQQQQPLATQKQAPIRPLFNVVHPFNRVGAAAAAAAPTSNSFDQQPYQVDPSNPRDFRSSAAAANGAPAANCQQPSEASQPGARETPVQLERCMIGREMVDWLLQLSQTSSNSARFVTGRLQAVSMWQVLLEQGLVYQLSTSQDRLRHHQQQPHQQQQHQFAASHNGHSSRAELLCERESPASPTQFFCDDREAYYRFWFDRVAAAAVAAPTGAGGAGGASAGDSANSTEVCEHSSSAAAATGKAASGPPMPLRPLQSDIELATDSLWWSLKLLSKLAPDACFRLILARRPHERTAEEVDIVYEELQHLKALSHLTNSVKKQLAACVQSEHHSEQNTVVFNQGDAGHSWYIILRGSVNVVIVGKGVVCTLHEGDDFGKLALVNDAPRAATIVTNEPNCYFLRVDKHNFNTILRDVEANTVRLKEHGKEVLILQKVATKEPPPPTPTQGQPGAQLADSISVHQQQQQHGTDANNNLAFHLQQQQQQQQLRPDNSMPSVASSVLAANAMMAQQQQQQQNQIISSNAISSSSNIINSTTTAATAAQVPAPLPPVNSTTTTAAAATPSSSSSSALKYMVMAGTGEKMLEHLLETRIDGHTQISPLLAGKANLLEHEQVANYIQCHGDNFLEDFILTHRIFMPTGNLCQELLKHYQCQSKQSAINSNSNNGQQTNTSPTSNNNNNNGQLKRQQAKQQQQQQLMAATSELDDVYLVAKKRRVVKFVRFWMLITREHFFQQQQIRSFLTTLHQKVKLDATRFVSLQAELQAVTRIYELHLEEDLESRHRGVQRWIDDIYGNILPIRRLTGLVWPTSSQTAAAGAGGDPSASNWPPGQPSEPFLASLHLRRFEHKLATLQAEDELVFRVYCADHSYTTLRTRFDEQAGQIKQLAARNLKLQDKELILVHVKSNGERIIYNDLETNISTCLSANGRLFVCPLDHIDAVSPLPEQDPFQEVYQSLGLSLSQQQAQHAQQQQQLGLANTMPAAAAAASGAGDHQGLAGDGGPMGTQSNGPIGAGGGASLAANQSDATATATTTSSTSASASASSASVPSGGQQLQQQQPVISSHLLSQTPINYNDIKLQMSLSVSKLEEFSSRDIAYCLTQLAWSLLKNMHEFELIYTVFGRHNFKQITANLNVFLRHFNEIQYWVVTQICLSTSLSKRVQILRKFIKIAAHCKELQNLNAFFAIIMGLSNMAVARLTQTWERLPSKLKRTFSQFESQIDPSRNHRRYRIFMSKLEPPIIPFMPLFLKDMTFAHEGNKTYLENGLINFEKMQMVAQTLRTLRYCKSRPMKLDSSVCKFKGSIRSIELFFRDLKIIDNQRTLTQMSHQLEHRKT